MMKNRCVFPCLLLIVLTAGGAPPVLASGRGVYLGLNADISPTVWFHNAYGAGAEAGFRISERLGLGAEIGFGSTAYKSSSGWQEDSYESTAKTTYSAMPASLSLYYVTPVSGRLAIYVGLGGGYYALSIKNETEEHSPYYFQPQTATDAHKARAFAPQVCLGFESGLCKNVAVVGEVRHSAGKTSMSTTDTYGFTSEQDIAFGGIQVKVGIRVMLGGSRRP